MRRSPHRTALRLALLYLALSGVWILFSDRIAASLAMDLPSFTRLHTLQDWAFALATSVLLFVLVRRALVRIAHSDVQAQRSENALRQTEDSLRLHDAALAHERNLLRTLIDNLPDYIFIKDAQSRFVVVNRAQADLLGVSTPEEAVGKTDLDFLPLEMAKQYRADEERIVTTGEPLLHQEERGPGRADGEVRWHLTTKVPLRDTGRRIVGLVGISRNITDVKRAEEALIRHTRQLEAIRSVGAELTRELNVSALLDLIVHRAAELIGVGSGTLYLWDDERQRLVAKAWIGPWVPQGSRTRRLGEGVAGAAAAQRRGMMVNEYRTSPFATPESLARPGLTAVLGEPLLYRERLIGVIALDNQGAGKVFTPEDGEILALLASQAAIAVENAHLYETARRERRTAEIVASVAQKLSASLDLKTILQEVVEGAQELCGSDVAEIAVRDPDSGVMVLQYATPASVGTLPHLEIFPGKGLGGQILLTGKPFRTDNYAEDARITKDYLHRVRALGAMTALGVPIRIESTIEGLIFVDNRTARPFTDRDETTLLRLADQAALAIRNARLYRDEMQRSKVLEAVRAVSVELARELDSARLLALITQRAADLLGVTSGILSLWDEDRRGFVPTAWLGFGDWVSEQVLPMGRGVTGTAGERRRAIIVNDYQEWPDANPTLRERGRVSAALAEPLLYRDRLLGVLAVSDNGTGRTFTAEDQAALALLAGHAAIAIENARLYTEVRQSLENLRHAQNELLRSEKLRALGQMSAGVAHDLNNTLAAILGQVELMQMQTNDPDLRESLGILEVAATDGAQVVRRLHSFARQQAAGELVPCDLARVVSDALEITRPRWRDEVQRRGQLIDVKTTLDELPLVSGQASEIREALTNLILNAVDAMPEGGTLSIAAHSVSVPPEPMSGSGVVSAARAPRFVELTVSDTGVGMTEDVRQRVFEPFFTTKGVQGTGLGLSMVYGIMERHGGRVEVASAPGKGTTFRLQFRSVLAEALPAVGPPSVPRFSRRVLVIDDDPYVRATVVRLLRSAGHHVVDADGGREALRRFAEDRIDLVITDLGMPEENGWEVAVAIKTRQPACPVILLTGWEDPQPAYGSPGDVVDRILHKPVRLKELSQAIAELTTQR